MRKIYSFMVAAVAMFTAASCAQELDKIEATDAGVFSAVIDGADTKTYKDGTKSLWSEGDKIWVLNGQLGDNDQYSWKKEYATTDNATDQAVFREVETYEMTGESFFAVYPSSAATDATWEGGDNDVNRIKLEPDQIAVDGSFDPKAHIAVAKTNDYSLAFKTAVALFKFKVAEDSDPINNITIFSNNEENRELISGLCNVSKDGNVTAWTNYIDENPETPEAYNWVALNAAEGTSLEAGQEYYIAVFPVTFANGFTVQVNKKHNIIVFEEEVTINRKDVINLKEIKYVEPDPTTIYFVPGQWASDNAWFAVAYDGGIHKMDIDSDGNYTYDMPGSVDKFAFYRMNGTSDQLTENNCWNKIEDVEVPIDENICYTWNSWEAPYGSWGPKPASKSFGIVGVAIGWEADIQMEKLESGVFVAKNITTIPAFTSWKIRANKAWDESYGSSITGIEANKWVTIGSNDATHAVDGAIDIYLDLKQKRIYVMAANVDYSTAVEQTESVSPPPAGTPAKSGYLYLKPNSNWTQANARFAAYFFGNGEKWVSMDDPDGDGIYEVAKQAGYNNVIFCRMNPGTTTNNWNNKWNQTADLNVPGDDKDNLYTITEGSWDAGKWSRVEIF